MLHYVLCTVILYVSGVLKLTFSQVDRKLFAAAVTRTGRSAAVDAEQSEQLEQDRTAFLIYYNKENVLKFAKKQKQGRVKYFSKCSV